jgi:predicted CoA-binding protein
MLDFFQIKILVDRYPNAEAVERSRCYKMISKIVDDIEMLDFLTDRDSCWRMAESVIR